MRHIRLLIGLIIIVFLISLMIYSSNGEPKPIDNKIKFVCWIENINSINQTLLARLTKNPPYRYIQIKTDKIDTKLKNGDMIEVLGILDGERHVTAEKILLRDQWKDDLVYIRSLPAIPFALYLLFREWRFNWKRIRFERRRSNS